MNVQRNTRKESSLGRKNDIFSFILLSSNSINISTCYICLESQKASYRCVNIVLSESDCPLFCCLPGIHSLLHNRLSHLSGPNSRGSSSLEPKLTTLHAFPPQPSLSTLLLHLTIRALHTWTSSL